MSFIEFVMRRKYLEKEYKFAVKNSNENINERKRLARKTTIPGLFIFLFFAIINKHFVITEMFILGIILYFLIPMKYKFNLVYKMILILLFLMGAKEFSFSLLTSSTDISFATYIIIYLMTIVITILFMILINYFIYIFSSTEGKYKNNVVDISGIIIFLILIDTVTGLTENRDNIEYISMLLLLTPSTVFFPLFVLKTNTRII